MAVRTVRIAMNGVTGRLGQNQHLANSIMAIRNEGGLLLASGDRLMPEPVLLGRSAEKLEKLAQRHGGLEWSTDAQAVISDPSVEIYFDVAATAGRVPRAQEAIAAGKHIYLEKPVADTLEEAMQLARAAEAARVKNGVVQDKVFLPGFHKLRKLTQTGFFGRLLSVKLVFGWWVFDGELYPSQRSSWNYKRAEGGGLIAPMRAVSCRATTQIPQRRDEQGKLYNVDVEDEVYATIELEGGVLAQITSSWATRVRQDDMLTLHVEGTGGSALVTLHSCFIQPMAATPRPVWHVDVRQNNDFLSHWQEMPDVEAYNWSMRATAATMSGAGSTCLSSRSSDPSRSSVRRVSRHANDRYAHAHLLSAGRTDGCRQVRPACQSLSARHVDGEQGDRCRAQAHLSADAERPRAPFRRHGADEGRFSGHRASSGPATLLG
jgi:predicted dehydrogenase